jgi:hypothetical protein
MGKEVKKLLEHLRERQTTMGVNAFHFKKIWKDKKFYPSKYPDAAKLAIEAGDEVLNWETLTDLSDVAETAPTATEEIGNSNSNPKGLSTMPQSANTSTTSRTEPFQIIHEKPTGSEQPPTLSAVEDVKMEWPSKVADSTDWTNIDPRLWPHADGLPPGDPFPNSKRFPTDTFPTTDSPMPTPTTVDQFPSSSKTVQWSPMPPKIIPPNFSAASTPARTPRKRKRSEPLELETPTSVRPKRVITTPKRYIEYS